MLRKQKLVMTPAVEEEEDTVWTTERTNLGHGYSIAVSTTNGKPSYIPERKPELAAASHHFAGGLDLESPSLAHLNSTKAHILLSPDQTDFVRRLLVSSSVAVSFSVCEPSPDLPLLLRATREISGFAAVEAELGRLASLSDPD